MKKLIFIVLTLITISSYATNSNIIKDNGKFKKILIVVAMQNTADPIINHFHLTQDHVLPANLPMLSYKGKYKNLDLYLIENGIDPVTKVPNVGTQASVLTTYLGIEHYHPDIIITAGTGGGYVRNGTKIGDIYLSKKIYYYDRRIPIKKYLSYSEGGYELFDTNQIAKTLHLKTGNICSGDSFIDEKDKTDNKIISQLNCQVVDMISAGVAWVGEITNTPTFAIKGITDRIDSPVNESTQFKKNVQLVVEKLPTVLQATLDQLIKTEGSWKA